jgi:hypothetical protein
MLPSVLKPTMSPGVLSSLLGSGLAAGAVTALAIVGLLVAVTVGAAFALSLDRRPTVAEVALVMLVIVVVTGKSMPVQAGLWLLPLIALVGLKWRDHLIWAGVEATYFVGVWLYIAGLSQPDRGLPRRAYCLLIVLRVAAWLFVLVQVWRRARSRAPVSFAVDPEPVDAKLAEGEPLDVEPVDAESFDWQQDEEVDPLAGPMAGAPDQLLVRIT